ncbi:MAG: outer membrane beta-barrel protein [Myxococcales bacterium]|nr:porin family protein [Myxococcales bacterium]
MRKIIVALAAAVLIAPAVWADSEFSIALQGGASHYTSSLSSGSDTGAAYGARLGILPTPMLGVELGYLGTQNNVKQSLDIGREASTLMTNEGYADVRLNLLPGAFTPYVFGGYGLTWVSGGAASGIPNRSVNTLPFGGGIEANAGAFKIGGRFQYNYLFDRIYTGNSSSGVPGVVGADKGGNSDFWGVTLDLGASFR